MLYLCHKCKTLHYAEDMAVIDDDGEAHVCLGCDRISPPPYFVWEHPTFAAADGLILKLRVWEPDDQ